MYINILLDSNMHIPMYASLLNFNASLFLRIKSKLLSNILRHIAWF